jgi:DNA ligase-associated putative exonuclease
MIRPEDLLCPTPDGLWCPLGGFHIDPVRPVARALITHGHADHARPGHQAVMATRETLKIMAARYGEGFAGSETVATLGDTVKIGDVTVSFHPAGHVLGSAQIAVEAKGLRIVASGDYKRRRDPTCAPFEPVQCDVFITEATFGLPVFRHPEDGHEIHKLLASLAAFPERAHLVGAYALGKAQRVIKRLREEGYDRTIYIHGALEKLCRLYEEEGIDLGPLELATVEAGRKIEWRRRISPARSWSGPLRLRGSLGAAFSRSSFLLCLGLDVDPPARQAARRRTATDHFGSLRLGRTDRDHRRDCSRRGLGHAWPRRGAGALVRTGRHPRPSPAHGWL